VDALATVVAALIGAALGSIGAVVVQSRVEEKRESERLKDALRDRHLLALQDAVESLWYRLKNVAEDEGAQLLKKIDPVYYETTNAYALGRALAAERLVALDGVFPQIAAAWPELGETLTTNRLDRCVKDTFGDRLFHYDIVLLAESVLRQSGDGANLRFLMYTEFRREFNDEATGLRSSVTRAIKVLNSLGEEESNRIRDSLSKLATELSEVTEVHTTVASPGVADND
jgi:hypothetical protein